MNIFFVDLSDHVVPPPNDVIRADMYISVPLALAVQSRGHEVTFVCPQGSTVQTKKLLSHTPPIIPTLTLEEFSSIDDGIARTEMLHAFFADLLLTLYEGVKKERPDLIHFHTNIPLMELAFLNHINIPSLITLHSITRFPDFENRVIHQFNTNHSIYYTSISDYQQTMFRELSFRRTIHNGINLQNFTFALQNTTDNLLFAGRLRHTKGVKEAMEAAINTQHKIHVTGALSSTDTKYFNDEIKPLIEAHHEYVMFDHHVDRLHIQQSYQAGKATLVPILWDEPFGLIMPESMACGTPVIAYARGSVPEIVRDGVTGFIVNSSDDDKRGDWIVKKTGIEGLQEAIKRIYAMPEEEYKQMRRNCRTHVEKNFSVERMVDQYEALYKEIIEKNHANR